MPGNSLFSPSSDPMRTVVLNVGGVETFGTLAEGYFNATKELLQGFEARGGRPDFDIYPIIYLFRHAVELSLKDMIGVMQGLAAFLGTGPTSFEAPVGHDLDALVLNLDEQWSLLKDKIGTEEEPLDDETRRAISDLAAADKASDAFRYPVDRRGKPFFQEHQVLGFGSLADTIAHVHDRFSGVMGFLYDREQTAEDMKFEGY